MGESKALLPGLFSRKDVAGIPSGSVAYDRVSRETVSGEKGASDRDARTSGVGCSEDLQQDALLAIVTERVEDFRSRGIGDVREEVLRHSTAEVVAIEHLALIEPVYDIPEVPDTHCFYTGIRSDLAPIVGKNCLDEGNFFQAKGKRNKDQDTQGQAEEIYNSTIRRMTSRFQRIGGYVPGLALLMSSKTSEDSFMERRKREAKKQIAEGKVKVSEYSVWEVRDPRIYVLPRFYVEVGDRMWPSKILDATNPDAAASEGRPGSDVIEVPGELRSHFESDVEKALRDIAGVATFGLVPLIRERWRIQKCIESAEWEHPFTRQEISLSDEDDTMLDDYFLPNKLFRIQKSTYVPRREPHMPRFVHVDIGLREDSLGISCGHVRGFMQTRCVRPDGTWYMNKMPAVDVDFILRVTPPKRGSIDLSKVRAFIISLRDMGLPIELVSFDGYQSADSVQILRKVGFNTQILSLDRTDEIYLSTKQAITDGRVRFYNHAHCVKELEHLERDLDRQKVDHPEKFPDGKRGSKDCSDSLAGVIYLCTTMPSAYEGLSVAAIGDSDVVASDRMKPTRHSVNWDAVERARGMIRR